jgi:SAM-dependent methyltransferase
MKNNVESLLVPFTKAFLIKRFPTGPIIDEWQALLDINISNEFDEVKELLLYRCEASQLEFFTPESIAGSEDLYANLRNFEWYYMADKWEFEQAIKDLEGCARILEVGCGPGLFIEKAIRRLPHSDIMGIELSESAVQKAKANKLAVESLDLHTLRAQGKCFDAVCCFQVMEHVNHPHRFLTEMVQLLRPGGRMILTVPNQDSFLQYQHNLLDMPPHHMTRWRSATFQYLEKLFPLELIRVDFEPLAKYHITDYVSAYARHWHSKRLIRHFPFSESVLVMISAVLKGSGLHRFLRGQSLYGVFEKK